MVTTTVACVLLVEVTLFTMIPAPSEAVVPAAKFVKRPVTVSGSAVLPCRTVFGVSCVTMATPALTGKVARVASSPFVVAEMTRGPVVAESEPSGSVKASP